MIGFLGDIHGAVWVLEQAAKRAKEFGATALVQVGDFGFYPDVVSDLKAIELPMKCYVIDGNHENFPWLWSGGHEVVSQLTNGMVEYVHRGTVLDIDGRRIGFLGGAGSIDERMRVRMGMSWYPEEQITEGDVERLLTNVMTFPPDSRGLLDALVTHTPPQSVITQHFDTPPIRALEVRRMFGAPPDWFDPSAHKVEAIWQKLDRPILFCGHMHRSVNHMHAEGGVCRILAENEIVYW